MDKCQKTASIYIATLKVIYEISLQNHWKAKGSNFYSLHLMFERIYKTTQDNIDQSAEKLLTLFGDDILDESLQNKLKYKINKKYESLDGIDQVSKIIKDFIDYSVFAYQCFEENNKKTLGLDDMIMSISNDQEVNLYLLDRSSKN